MGKQIMKHKKYFFIFSYQVNQVNGFFLTVASTPSTWVHSVVNFIGPDNGEGIRVYHSGNNVASKDTIFPVSRTAGNGRITIGRRYAGFFHKYASVEVDVLVFFNSFLSADQIQSLRWLASFGSKLIFF